MKTILVVEDDEPSLKLLRELLTRERHRVLASRSMREAFALAAGERPDLILVDLDLAAAGGLAAVRMLKTDPQLRIVPVLALSSGSEDRTRAAEAGCSSCIAKPLQAKPLLEAVRKLLG